MDGRAQSYRRVLSVGLLVLSTALAVQEVWRIALFGVAGTALIAAVATAVWLPLHLWHLREGLAGRRPAHGGVTLLVMVAVHVTAGLLVGPAWAFMLAGLATSAMVVLRPVPAAAVLVACAGYAAALPVLVPQPPEFFVLPAYLAVAVVFRSVLQFALVWLVAATYQLETAREAMTASTVERTRRDLRDGIGATVERNRAGLLAAVAAVPHAPAAATVRPALAEVADRARGLLTEVRSTAARLRDDPPTPAVAGTGRATRALGSPVAAGFATVARARWVHRVVLAVIFGFLLLSGLGLLVDFAPPMPWWQVLGPWAIAAAAYTVAAHDVVADATPARRRVLALVLVVLSAVVIDTHVTWTGFLAFIVTPVAVAFALPARARPWCGAAGLVAAIVVDVVTVVSDGWTAPMVGWVTFYTVTVHGLAIGSLMGAAMLVQVTERMHDVTSELGARAAQDERRRIGGELHDLLVQDLSAVGLKADLATRLVDRDPDAATREIAELREILRHRSPTLSGLGADAGTVTVEAEATRAAELLRGFGVTVRLDLDPGPATIPPRYDELLGWAVREGAANVLRHSRARSCTIVLFTHPRGWAFDMINDGSPETDVATGGSGLASLSERFGRLDGRLRGYRPGADHFRLRAELPRITADDRDPAAAGTVAP